MVVVVCRKVPPDSTHSGVPATPSPLARINTSRTARSAGIGRWRGLPIVRVAGASNSSQSIAFRRHLGIPDRRHATDRSVQIQLSRDIQRKNPTRGSVPRSSPRPLPTWRTNIAAPARPDTCFAPFVAEAAAAVYANTKPSVGPAPLMGTDPPLIGPVAVTNS